MPPNPTLNRTRRARSFFVRASMAADRLAKKLSLMGRFPASLLLLLVCTPGIATELRYPVPTGAKDQRHVRLSDTGGEQDFFEITQPYPSTSVLYTCDGA